MFRKEFVRVESLAIARAIELQKEAGFPDLYLTESMLSDEKGIAREFAAMGEELFDSQGQFVRSETLTPDRLNLKGEIEGFLESDQHNEMYRGEMFLMRHYMFYFNTPVSHRRALWVNVVYGKVRSGDDWSLLVESVFAVDEKGFYAHDPSIYRDYHTENTR